MIDFYLDECALSVLLAKANENLSKILLLVEAIERVRDCKNCTFKLSEDFYELQLEASSFADLIFQNSDDNRDAFLRLQICLDKSTRVQSEEGKPLFGTQLLAKAKIGGIIASNDLSHLEWWNKDSMYSVRTAAEIPASMRFIFLAMKLDAPYFDLLLEEMYPQLYFFDKPNCKKMGLTYVDNISKLMSHLNWLNDHGNEAYSRHPHEDFAANAGSFDVTISPESPLTHKNKIAVRERTISVNGKEIFCEWHSKIEKTKGRIHFVPNSSGRDDAIKELAGEKLIIGVVARHLT